MRAQDVGWMDGSASAERRLQRSDGFPFRQHTGCESVCADERRPRGVALMTKNNHYRLIALRNDPYNEIRPTETRVMRAEFEYDVHLAGCGVAFPPKNVFVFMSCARCRPHV